MDNLNNNTNQNLKIKVVSISHDEDVDGIGAQAIINRYFSILNSNLIEGLGGSQAYAVFSQLFNEIREYKIKNGVISQEANIEIELINLRTDYTSYFVYWASILAGLNQNKSKNEDEAEPDGENLNKLYKQITGTDLIECSSIKRTLKKLNELKEDLRDIDLLIITDLGLNEGSETLIDLLRDLKENKINIAYFDHHTHGAVIKEFFKNYCVAYVNDDESEVIKEQIEQHVIFIAINTLSWEVVLRSHNISVDKIARKLNGGGHRERAGFILPKEFIRNTIDGELDLNNLNVRALVNVIAELI